MAEAGEGLSHSSGSQGTVLTRLLGPMRVQKLKASGGKRGGRKALPTDKLAFPAEQYGLHPEDRHRYCVMRPSLSLLGIAAEPDTGNTATESSADSTTERDVADMELMACPPLFLPLEALQPLPIPTGAGTNSNAAAKERTSDTAVAAAADLRSQLDRGTLCGSRAVREFPALAALSMQDWARLWEAGGPLSGFEQVAPVNGVDARQTNWQGMRQLLRVTGARALAELLLVEKGGRLWPAGEGHGGNAGRELLETTAETAQLSTRSEEEFAALMERLEGGGMAAEALAVLSAVYRKEAAPGRRS